MTQPQARRRWLLVAVAASLMAAGAAMAYFATRTPSSTERAVTSSDLGPPSSPLGNSAASLAPGDRLPDVTLTLASDVLALAGIVIRPATAGMVASRVVVSGIVEPNMVRQVAIVAPASGRITTVSVETGVQVDPGRALAQIESPDLAQAQAQLLSTRAGVAAAQLELQKLEKLMEVGAVSRQEIDRARAVHAARVADLDATRARLALLDMSPDQIAALISAGIPAAATNVVATTQGTIVQRDVSEGQRVEAGSRLFTIADLSSIWIAGDLDERELSRVRVGSLATASAAALPDAVLSGSVIYIDSQVNTATHAAHIRVEVENPRSELQVGMPAELSIGDAGSTEATLVPKEALQAVGDRQVVYLADAAQPGTFVEREVRVGLASGDQVVVLSGVTPGDQVVVKGSVFLRAERERLGLRTGGTQP